MIRIVLDSNILISAFLFHGKPAKIFDLATDKEIISVTSPHILAEVALVFAKKFKQDEKLIRKQIKTIKDISELVVPTKKIKILKYKPDNKILETALAGKADYIVTGDRKHLLPLKEFKGIPIITPARSLIRHCERLAPALSEAEGRQSSHLPRRRRGPLREPEGSSEPRTARNDNPFSHRSPNPNTPSSLHP